MATVYSLTSLVGAGIKKATCYIRSKMVLTDSDLIARAQDGDDEAFNELVCRHQDFVYRQALSYLQDCDSAKDAAQEVFIKVYHGLVYFQNDSHFQAWLYRICRNHCLNVTRRLKIEENARFESGNSENPDLPLQFKLKKMISKLNNDYKEIIILRYYQDLKYDEIARLLSISISTVKIRLFRAKKMLKDMMG